MITVLGVNKTFIIIKTLLFPMVIQNIKMHVFFFIIISTLTRQKSAVTSFYVPYQHVTFIYLSYVVISDNFFKIIYKDWFRV